jgi:hypothetical protein
VKHRFWLTFALVALSTLSGRAQIVVTDPAVTLRNSVTAVLNEYLSRLHQQQSARLLQMSRRLSRLTNLAKYVLTDTPEWRIHEFLDEAAVLYARDYHAALNYGDGSGTAYVGVTIPLVTAFDRVTALPLAAQRQIAARLATVNLADATIISGTNDDGHLRYNGRREQEAIEGLERHVVDPSDDQSGTAVLEKWSGAALIGARQRQSRTAFLAAIVEQLIVDTKRTRDTDAASLNMQLTSWRNARGANDAFVAGTGDALRTWRQP